MHCYLCLLSVQFYLSLHKHVKIVYIKTNCNRPFTSMDNLLPGETKHLVFVYGTLKRSEPNQKFWSIATYHDHSLEQPKKGKFHLLATGETLRKLPLIIATKHNVSLTI